VDKRGDQKVPTSSSCSKSKILKKEPTLKTANWQVHTFYRIKPKKVKGHGHAWARMVPKKEQWVVMEECLIEGERTRNRQRSSSKAIAPGEKINNTLGKGTFCGVGGVRGKGRNSQKELVVGIRPRGGRNGRVWGLGLGGKSGRRV